MTKHTSHDSRIFKYTNGTGMYIQGYTQRMRM